ncbi:hypothetical protein PQX77_015615 [Marasmius sp. AFHP31]|nr:hypothetical protein PQX77_015615 [Marasmius sp. AFHP31]
MASRQDKLEEALGPYLTVQSVIVKPIATLSLMFLIYGMYTIIFGLCMHVLHQRRSCSGLYPVCTVLLFAFASLYVALYAYGIAHESVIEFDAAKMQDLEPFARYMVQGDSIEFLWGTSTDLLYPLMNILADIMLVHRCYILWGSRSLCLSVDEKFVQPGIYLATAIMVIISQFRLSTLQHIYIQGRQIDDGNSIALSVFNGFLSLLTAGRIWWISQEVGRHSGVLQLQPRHKAIVTAILESGLLYPATGITTVVVNRVLDPDHIGLSPIDLGNAAVLMSGLAPTLVFVRVAYGNSVDSVQQQMMSIHLSEEASWQRTGLGTSMPQAAMDIQSNPQTSNLENCMEDPKPEVEMKQSQTKAV